MRGSSHVAKMNPLGVTRRYQWFLPVSLNHHPPPIPLVRRGYSCANSPRWGCYQTCGHPRLDDETGHANGIFIRLLVVWILLEGTGYYDDFFF